MKYGGAVGSTGRPPLSSSSRAAAGGNDEDTQGALTVVHFNGPEKPWVDAATFAVPTAHFMAHVDEYNRRYLAWVAGKEGAVIV